MMKKGYAEICSCKLNRGRLPQLGLVSAQAPSKRGSEYSLRALLVGLILCGFVCVTQFSAYGQSIGAGTIEGTVLDQNNAAVVGASVRLSNRVTGFNNIVQTDDNGAFKFNGVPMNNYLLTVSANGFAPSEQTVEVRTTVPIVLKLALSVSGASATVTVSAGSEAIENVPSAHVDIAEAQIAKLPTTTPGSGLSDIITYASPGVAADSNGFFHPLGDHAQAQFSIDNQPITDQQSKGFSTQLPPNAVQSLEVLWGAIPAEYGDKTSLVINATTRSGLGLTKPQGSYSSEYGTYGASEQSATFGIGSANFGTFTAFNFERSGRFLDAPELAVFHDRGTGASIFQRFDYDITPKDASHLNLFLARNNFQIPNSYEQEALGQDQHQLVRSINIAPGYVHTFNASTILSINPYFRLDQVWYFPSANPFADQTQTLGQQRRLANLGLRADVAHTKGRHNAKFGFEGSHTLLTENFQFGITDPVVNPVCLDASGNPVAGSVCNGTTSFPNPNFLPGLLAFDLTRGGEQFVFHGHTDIKEEALYGQDAITLRNLTLSVGLRFDNYNGIVADHAFEPRIGTSYLVKRFGTVLRASYVRTFETPYNENLILSSATGAGGLAGNGVLDQSTSNQPLRPGRRNQFNAGFEQAFGRHVMVNADYFWKYTDNAYDFNVILNSPLAFPISWNKSKLDGLGIRASLTDFHGLSVYFNAGHTRARYFPPEVGGLFFNSNLPTGAFRIDHDQAFQQTTNVLYYFERFKKVRPYLDFTWRYDSGLVSGSVPDFATALTFTPDEQAQIGLFCGSTFATPTQGISSCTNPIHGATRVIIPAPGTENDDTNPPRIAPRHLFDLAVGSDNLFKTERAKVTLRFSAINLTNKDALYNFESTFSGTHFVAPRTFSARLGVVF